MAKNSIGKMNPTDQKDANKQSYPKSGPNDSIAAAKGKVGKAMKADKALEKGAGKRMPFTSKRGS